MAFDRFFVFVPLVGMAGVKRVAHPFQHVDVEAKLPEQRTQTAVIRGRRAERIKST
jgi:hypothetical protein